MSVLLTAKFKVHNPSRRKQEVINTALEEYTRAYSYLLDWCRENLATIEAEGKFRDRYSETSIRKLMPKTKDLNHFRLHSSAYDALLVDVSGAITSYLQLKQQDPNTTFPTCRDPDPEAYPNALEEFAAVLDDEQEYNERRNRLLKLTRSTVMPIYFSRADGVPRNRNFSLLWDAEKERFHAIVFLMPRGEGNPVNATGNLFRMGWACRTSAKMGHIWARN